MPHLVTWPCEALESNLRDWGLLRGSPCSSPSLLGEPSSQAATPSWQYIKGVP